MPNDQITVDAFLRLGQNMECLQNPHRLIRPQYVAKAKEFLIRLDELGFPATRSAASQYDGMKFIGGNDDAGALDPATSKQLGFVAESVRDTLYHEAEKKEVIICATDVTTIFAALPKALAKPLERHQDAILQDTIRCFKAKAYRPAIVMAWNLGYDLVRSWIFESTSRLGSFNSLLKNRTKNGRQIIEYEDLFKENESFVLQICRDAEGDLQQFDQKTYRSLESLLDDRNGLAHANFDHASEAYANAYIERVVRVITNQPFK